MEERNPSFDQGGLINMTMDSYNYKGSSPKTNSTNLTAKSSIWKFAKVSNSAVVKPSQTKLEQIPEEKSFSRRVTEFIKSTPLGGDVKSLAQRAL